MGTKRMIAIWIVLFVFITGNVSMMVRRSIDLSLTNQLMSETRLLKDIVPHSYVLDLRPNILDSSFHGKVTINVTVQEKTDRITLHAHQELTIETQDISVQRLGSSEADPSSEADNSESHSKLKIRRADHTPKKNVFVIYLTDYLKVGVSLQIEIGFSGNIWENPEGLFKGSYSLSNGTKLTYLATYLRPNNARRLFPCFDDPALKVPFTVSISRPKCHTTLFTTGVLSSEPLDGEPETVVDHFETTPPMSTFSLGFVTSQLDEINETITENEETGDAKRAFPVTIYARPELEESLNQVYNRVEKILETLKKYLNAPYPIEHLKIVALPGMNSVKPGDSWGLIIMKESDLITKGYYSLAQEIAYQWVGHFISPFWWTDAHVNKALAGYLAVNTAIEIDNGSEFDGKWPMTILYSIYYEFSKRYPHSKITGMKQETTCSKTELLLRMLNYTLGKDTFKRGIQNFVADREYKTFHADDLWTALTKEAHADNVLPKEITVNDIALSWITKDRLPVVTVERNYKEKTAQVSQKVFLRERPHDVPEQEKMLWVIPLIVVQENHICFQNSTPRKWMANVKEVQLTGLLDDNQFVIVNPEEIGPFPVNYDESNWNLLVEYLQTENGRNQIPVYTRAKLLHDAWNLAYGGHLSFATAFNMTLFMRNERNHLVWNPIFTMIDHIGRHIDMSTAHKKFETYVQILLSPLYEELGAVEQPNEEPWKDNLRSLAKTFLCRVGYKPCVEEAQTAFRSWMHNDNPDEGNPVPNQYICPVFKWGSQEEWEFGLMRVINFPATRKQNERTYLLKTLASCPIQEAKIERLLNVTILEENGNFTENDIFLVFNMLSGGSSGYKTLFNFLSNNWVVLKQKFENKTNLWDNLISSATGAFTTQEGYDMVSHLYVNRQGEFGSAEHIIEKSLRNVKEETKWSAENLPTITKWMDQFLKKAQRDSPYTPHAG